MSIHSGKEHWMKWAPKHVFAKNIFDQSLTFKAMSEFFAPPNSRFCKSIYSEWRYRSMATSLSREKTVF